MAKYTNHKRNNKKNSPFPLLLVGAGLILLAIAAAVMLPKEVPAEPTPTNDPHTVIPGKVDYAAPALTLRDVDGKTVSLDDYRGQVVLVNNWATWCPPCRAEMPELNAYYEAHKQEGFVLIGISAGDSQEQVREFIDSLGITFPMWLDPKEDAMRAFRTEYLPSSFVIDPQGTVRLAWTGAISLQTLEDYVTPLLGE